MYPKGHAPRYIILYCGLYPVDIVLYTVDHLLYIPWMTWMSPTGYKFWTLHGISSTGYIFRVVHGISSTGYIFRVVHGINKVYSTVYKVSSTPLNHTPVQNPPFRGYIPWRIFYIRLRCPFWVYPVDDIYPVGNILWGKFYILWARGFIPWVYPVECRFQIYIPWGLYPVDDGSPRDIRVVVHGIYIPWVYPVGVIEFYR